MTTATKICPKCGEKMPAEGKPCPNCTGWQNAKSLASKAVIALVALVAILLLASMVASRIYDAYNAPKDAEWKQRFEQSR
jgi:hypothetical protein